MIQLGKWALVRDHFKAVAVPAFAQISGGRTSAMMAALCSPDVRLVFENTGREHPKTLEFLARLQDGLCREVTWLEFRGPARHGAPPREFLWEVVNFDTASRDGTPFRTMLECIAAYRETKGLGPISPWARSRICTVYLKRRMAERWIASQGIDTYDSLLGLRYDEPKRVHSLAGQATQAHGFRAPLFDAKITKPDVLAFWSAQPFDLELEEHQGNCTGCFLKDQSDLARVLQEPETDAAWWKAIEIDFPSFGGRDFAGYAQLEGEGELREEIRAALRQGQEPALDEWDTCVDARRFGLIVRQERRRISDGASQFSCACESTFADDDRLDGQMELRIPYGA